MHYIKRILFALLITASCAAHAASFSDQMNAVFSTLNINGGTIDDSCFGCTTPAAVHATTISASGPITSSVVTGTAPFVVSSTTPVLNLTATNLSGGTVAATTISATVANPSLNYQSSATGSVARGYQSKLGDTVSVLDFGADPTGVADSTTAFTNWFNQVLITHRGRINSGTYKISSQVFWDLASVATTGINIFGDGENNTVIDVTAVTTSPQFFIGSASTIDLFYSKFKGFAIRGNAAGPVLQLGQTNYADKLNEFLISLVVNNASTSPSNIAVESNEVLNSNIRLVANCSGRGNGDAVRLNQSTFNIFSGSWSNALNSVHITNGYNYGNVFLAMDYEVASVGALIDSANALNNTFIGGQWEDNVNAINATAGSNNRFVGPNFAYSSPVNNAVGVRVSNSIYGNELFGSVTSGGPIKGAASVATDNTAGNSTISAAEMLTGDMLLTGSTSAYTVTTDTAANIIASIPNAVVGVGYELTIGNTVGYPATLAGGAGVTLYGNTAMAASSSRKYVVTISNIVTPSVNIVGVSSAGL